MINRSVYFSGNVKQEDGTESIIDEKKWFSFENTHLRVWMGLGGGGSGIHYSLKF